MISQPNIIICVTTVKERLQDQFIQKWFSDIDNASGGEFYSHLKNTDKIIRLTLNYCFTIMSYYGLV
jgi:hypothetical protein